jgi:Ser/Thr protein kinase RdoA (MazF antagonist)
MPMSSPAQPADADIAGLLREYDLGELVSAEPLAGGRAAVLRIDAGCGSFVLKAATRLADVELQASAALFLNERGIRQARILRTRAGTLVSSDGRYLQEFLPGSIIAHPGHEQAAAAMRHIAAYHQALADVPNDYQPEGASIWTRVADPGYLVGELSGLMNRYGIDDAAAQAALRVLDQFRWRLGRLPRQMVHGDLGPDNVLMRGARVVSVIDFTPFYESALFGACTALYWYHIHGAFQSSPSGRDSGGLSLSKLRWSMATMAEERPWTRDELALWPVGLLREALRRLATPLAVAAESGHPPGPSLAARRAALLAVARALPELGQP